MKRHADRPLGEDLVYTAVVEACPDCGRVLPVYRARMRRVQGLDTSFRLVRRDKRCGPTCPGSRPVWFAYKDLRVVLPARIYATAITLHIGERHLTDGFSLGRITRDLNARGIPLEERTTGRLFRDFLALTTLARGSAADVQARLRAQGGVVLMCDGVQFDERAPVLYLAWDAVSGTPLFGERKPFRGEDDLIPLLERVRAMDVPLLGIVTDKERGLVPAIQSVFPKVPYQFCHTHFLKNCARPLQTDLHDLAASVARRAEGVRAVAKALHLSSTSADSVDDGTPSPQTAPVASDVAQAVASPAASRTEALPAARDPQAPTPLTEEDLAHAICDLVRANSRVGGKAPLDPPELERHERLETIRALVNEARGKKVRATPHRTPVPCLTTWPTPST